MLVTDTNLFSECSEKPPGSLDVHGLFNMDELQIGYSDNSDTIHLSGNVTSVWDIKPDDRIVVKWRLLRKMLSRIKFFYLIVFWQIMAL